jgi:hypothetical protein
VVIFAMVSVACFLLGLAFIRPPIRGYVASSIIEYGGLGAKEGLAAELDDYGDKAIKVRPAEEAKGHYVVSLEGRDRGTTLETLEQEVSQIVSRASVVRMIPDRDAIARAAQEVATAEQREQEAHEAFDAWRRKQPPSEQPAQAVDAGIKPGLAAPRALRDVRTSQLNPQWAELVQQLERLKTQREQLLLNRTAVHPAVIDVEMRIGEAEQQLAATEQFLSSGNDFEAPSLEPDQPAEASQASETPVLPNTTEGERLKAAWEAALSRLTAAREDYTKAIEKRIPALPVHVDITRAPEIVGITGGELRREWVVALALASLFAGLGFARAGVLSTQAAVFAAVEEITQTLKIPVISALSTGDGPAIPHRAPRRIRAANLAARASAVAATCLSAAYVYSAAVDPLVLQVAATDPVRAYALAIELVWPL